MPHAGRTVVAALLAAALLTAFPEPAHAAGVTRHGSAAAHRRAPAQPAGPTADALVRQGVRLELGIGEEPDAVAAHALYCEAAAQGHAEALVRLGWMYADGRGVDASRDVASTLFDRAARFGSDEAMSLARERFPLGDEVLPQCLQGSAAQRGLSARAPTAAEVDRLLQLSRTLAPLRPSETPADRRRVIQFVAADARRFTIDPRLVVSIIAAESGFDPAARSARDAVGLMQLIPDTAERFAVADSLEPRANVNGGMAYLRWLMTFFQGDVARVVAAYNAGEGNVRRHAGVPPFAETRAYVARVAASYPFARHYYQPAPQRTDLARTGDRQRGTGRILASRSAPSIGSVPDPVRN